VQTLTHIPDRIDAGTSVEYTRSLPDYAASDGWTLKLILQGAVRLIKAATTASDGKSFNVVLLATDTDDLTPGVYSWTEKVTNVGLSQTKTACSGTLEVFPDVEAAAAGSLQVWEEQALAMIEKVIAFHQSGGTDTGRLAADIQEYEIAGRRVIKHDLAELLALRRELRAALKAKLRPGRLETPVRVRMMGQIRP